VVQGVFVDHAEKPRLTRRVGAALHGGLRSGRIERFVCDGRRVAFRYWRLYEFERGRRDGDERCAELRSSGHVVWRGRQWFRRWW